MSRLAYYNTPGYYNRKGTAYDAKFAYNQVQNDQMLLWLLEAAGLDKGTLTAARSAAEVGKTNGQKAAAVRKHAPWDRAVELLWPVAA